MPADRSFRSVRLKKKILIFLPCLSCFVLTHRNHRVLSVAWSPDGTKLASGSWDNSIRIWETSTGTCVSTLSGHYGYVTAVSYSCLFSNVLCVLTIEHFTAMS